MEWLILAVVATSWVVALRYILSAKFRAENLGCFANFGAGMMLVLAIASTAAIGWGLHWAANTPRGPRCLGPDGYTEKSVRGEWECQGYWHYIPPEEGWRPQP